MRRPAHSRQRSTGQSVGAPQSSHLGSPGGRKELRQESQMTGAEAPQETQREGKSSSVSHALHATRRGVTCQ
jgi:hypothetical protein